MKIVVPILAATSGRTHHDLPHDPGKCLKPVAEHTTAPTTRFAQLTSANMTA